MGDKKQQKEDQGIKLSITKEEGDIANASKDNGGLEFIFPYGATLNAQKPATPVLSSGPISYPLNRPVAAVYNKEGMGRIAVLGSVRMLDDEYFDKEKNKVIADTLIKWLLGTS